MRDEVAAAIGIFLIIVIILGILGFVGYEKWSDIP